MELNVFFDEQKIIYNQRLKKHEGYLVKPFEEVRSLLGSDEGQFANFKTFLYITFLYHEPEKLKYGQEEHRKAKELKEKISRKALELSSLLSSFHDTELFIENDHSLIFSLDLIKEAGKRIYAKNGTRALHAEESQDYKKGFLPVLETLSKNIDVYYSCPSVDEIIFELHKKMNAIEFTEPEIRQPTARATAVKFYQHLIKAVTDKHLKGAILDISPETVAGLINIILDLEPNATISGETARKALYKAKDNCD